MSGFARPWIEETMYCECPHCGDSTVIESDQRTLLPEVSYETECDKCKKDFTVLGTKDDL